MNCWGIMFNKRAAIALAILCAMIQLAPAAEAAKRVALVIGNDTYLHLRAGNQLERAGTDAASLGRRVDTQSSRSTPGSGHNRGVHCPLRTSCVALLAWTASFGVSHGNPVVFPVWRIF